MMAVGLMQLCVITIIVSMIQLSMGKEINSTKDLTKEETTGFETPWQYDADSGSKSKSLSSSSSKSHGEGYGKGTGYGENVRKEKESYGHSDDSSGSGYGGSENHEIPKKGKVHVFNLNGQSGPIYAQTYSAQYNKDGYDSSHGGYNSGPEYKEKEGGYSSEQYDKSGESEQEPGYGRPSHSSGGLGYSLNRPYGKTLEPTIVRYQSFNSPPSSSSPNYDSKIHSRKPQFNNQQIHGKIDEDLSVFIRQLGNLPLGRFSQNGNQKKNGEREGYLLLPVLPKQKQYGPGESNKPGHEASEGSEEQRSNTGVYTSEVHGKSLEGSYPSGYGLSPELISSYGSNSKQQSYPDPQQTSHVHGSNSAQSITPQKYLITFDNKNAQSGSYGGLQQNPLLYTGNPGEGKYVEPLVKINPYEDKVYREGSHYKTPVHTKESYTKDSTPVKNNYYDAGKVFELKPNGQQFFSGPVQGIPSDHGKAYSSGHEEYPPLGHETTSGKPNDGGNFGVQYSNQRQLEKLNLHNLNRPGAYQNQISLANLKVKNPNANLYRQENHPHEVNPYTGQNFPDIGFPIGGDYEQPLENPQQIKHTINHEPLGVSVMYKNTGHGIRGGLGRLHLMPNLIGSGQGNFQPGHVGYPGGNALFHNNLAAQFNQLTKPQSLYNRPSQRTKSIALFLSKPNQLNMSPILPPVMRSNFLNPYKAPLMNLRPGIPGKYGNGLLALNMYPGMHGLGSSLSPVIHTDLINLY